MRILEPRHFTKRKKKRIVMSRFNASFMIVSVLIMAMVAYGYSGQSKPSSGQKNEGSAANTRDLRDFSEDEFRSLYDTIIQPNLENIETPPHITGNETADARIRILAEEKGYRLSRYPASQPSTSNQEDILLQSSAKLAWNEMKSAAELDGLNIQISSGYVSIDQQRAEFLREFRDYGVFTESVALGYVDDRVERVLKSLPPPGYLRHHTGYVVTIDCKNDSKTQFNKTQCFTWLSDQNYRNAKAYGWVPSYSPNVTDASEFVWVGKDTTFR